MTISRIGFDTVLACWLAAAGPAWAAPGGQDQPGRQKEDSQHGESKAENKKEGSKKNPPAPPKVVLDFKVTVEDMNPLPADSTADLKGLDQCEAMETTRLNPDGQGKFLNVPQCKVQIRIFITGFNTGFVQVDVAKHKDSPVQIQMKSSGAATVVNP